MNSENVVKFYEAACTDEALKAKVSSISAEAKRHFLDGLVALSQETAHPFSREDLIIAMADKAEGELSDLQLVGISGGEKEARKDMSWEEVFRMR